MELGEEHEEPAARQRVGGGRGQRQRAILAQDEEGEVAQHLLGLGLGLGLGNRREALGFRGEALGVRREA